MESIPQRASPDVSQAAPAHRAANDSIGLLKDALKLCQQWMERFPVDDPERRNLVCLQMSLGYLINSGEPSALDMSNIRALLCTNCRRISAAQGRCSGQPLNRCPLLNGSQP